MFVGASDAEVAEPACVADGDAAAGVDGVVADPPVLVAVAEPRFGFGKCLVGRGRGALAQGAVGAFVVVEVLERSQCLRVWWKRSILPWVCGWPG